MRVWRACGWQPCLAFGLRIKTDRAVCVTCDHPYPEESA